MTEPKPESDRGRLAFRRRHRLRHNRQFRAVYAAKVRKAGGPLVVFVSPNGLDHPRLGLSVGRRVGNAVTRNRIKRLLREAFRLDMTRLPAGYDLVVNVRAHRPMPLSAYRRALTDLSAAAAAVWDRRRRREEASP